MVPVASAITSLFLDEVAQAVEDKHYPHLPQVRSVPFGEAMRDTVNFLGVSDWGQFPSPVFVCPIFHSRHR